ncbi:MAG: hypothetical protein LBK82_17560 [Planctomycetaceae bacterium]|jgi:hypothetical protein|nr:hypothetical protein [Planctomycetaceae bacterium]
MNTNKIVVDVTYVYWKGHRTSVPASNSLTSTKVQIWRGKSKCFPFKLICYRKDLTRQGERKYIYTIECKESDLLLYAE